MGQRIRVGAVSYLNTVPLIWGMQHGPQQAEAELRFAVPAICAAQLENGLTDIGLVPVAEIARQQLTIVSNVGISCRGPVRSILLCSRKPMRQVKTLAADAGSRTSVRLAEVILRERYGVQPKIHPAQPQLESMLATADAALVIGDPALLIDPATAPYEILDLGMEWWALTGLPMVFAAWAQKAVDARQDLLRLTRDSYNFGCTHLTEAITAEAGRRAVSLTLAYEYLTRYIRFDIGREEERGLQAFWEMAGLTPEKVMA